ncbi:MAG: protein kinase domain-containing protein [Calditrichia bacterium]
MQKLVGKTIDNYKILGVIGRGGMGTVYKALDQSLDKHVALKMIEPRLIENKNFLKRFLEEPKLQAKLESPYIVRVNAFRESNETLFIVMEFVDGATLAQKLRQSGAMHWTKALPIFKQMLLAIGHAHKVGVIHRDIKPGNVLIAKDDSVKVTDFGLAKFQQHGDITVTKAVAGTVKYMSPEQVRGLSNVDHRGDIYALGITLYEMLAGRVPFLKEGADYAVLKAIVEDQPPPPTQFNGAIPQVLEDIVMKSLRKDANERFQTAEEMLEAVERFEQSSDEQGTVGRTQQMAPTITILKDIAQNPVNLKWVALPIIAVMVALAGWLVGPPLLEFIFPAQKFASLDIRSEPSGAVVYFDNIPQGKTPFQTDSVETNIIDIRVEKAGFGYWEKKNVLFEAGQSVEFSPTLIEGAASVYGSLKIDSDPTGAIVWLNGKQVGKTPFSSDSLPTQDYLVRLSKNGFEEFRETISLSADQPENMSAFLVKVPVTTRQPQTGSTGSTQNSTKDPFLAKPPSNIGQLELRLEPSGSIFVNGGHKARSDDEPATASVAVDKGEHKVRFVHPQYGSRDFSLSVDRGETKSLTCYFESFLNIQSLDENGSSFFSYLVINGENTGVPTPIANYPLGPGTYRISVRRLGYHTVEDDKVITVTPRRNKPKTQKLVFTLEKE